MTSRPEGFTYRCLRVPADGSPPERVPYTVTAEKFKGPDIYLDMLPDLRPYWPNEYRTRKLQGITIDDQEEPILNGEVLLYYTVDSGLPANKSLLKMPALHAAVEKSLREGVKFSDRVFYRGDMYIVRMAEWFDRTGYKAQWEDVSPELVQPLMRILDENVFSRNWNVEYLEKQVTSDEFHDEVMSRHDRAKTNIMETMPPEIRDDPTLKPYIELMALMAAEREKRS